MGIPAISHPPRILMLYGSVRERSYSRLATEEAGRLLTAMGADVRIFNPSGLPRHCCKVSDEAAFCLIQRPYISKTLLTRRISPRG
ncbi:NADPH-dependent FMN reductase, partial [Escherichia coli]|uniref:NADPH-dependent FMN reductase n=1 Tax=Escherichia coli TaxID=562 RepID=UPI001874936E